MHFCYKCKKELDVRGAVGRESLCFNCQSHVHCCRNCRFYRKDSNYNCGESQAECIPDKETANYCDYFVLKDYTSPPVDPTEEIRRAKARLDELFKKLQ